MASSEPVAAGQDGRVDDAIAAAPAFAQPILRHLRALVHRACPEAGETIKWGRPFFIAGGRPLAFMAAFKAHVGFGLWQADATGREAEGAGQYGRLVTLADLPPDAELEAALAAAAARTASERAPRSKPAARPAAEVPPVLAAALDADPAARACFDRLPPSRRRETIEWIAGAKREETRARRVAKAIARLGEGKDLDAATR